MNKNRKWPLHIIVQWNFNFCQIKWQTGIDEFCKKYKKNVNKIYLLCLKYCLVYFSFHRSIHWKNHIWLESLVSEQTVEYQSVEQNACNPTPQIDSLCKNKQEFSDFWTISYCFVHIVMLIIIQMHFVLLTTISLLFVCEGHFWIILKKGKGLSPQSPPPSARACLPWFTMITDM